MTEVAAKHIRQAAFFIGEDLRRRRDRKEQIPRALREVSEALTSALFADEQPTAPVLSNLKSTKELAAEWNCTPTTVRRRAAAAGGRKINGRWIFEEDT